MTEHDDLYCFAIGAFKYCKLPRPAGETYLDVAARCLGISTAECRRIIGRGAPASRAHKRVYRRIQFALEQRGHLRDVPPFIDLLLSFEFDDFLAWLADNHIDELFAWWDEIQREGMH